MDIYKIWDEHEILLEYVGISFEDLQEWKEQGFDLVIRKENEVLWNNPDTAAVFANEGLLYSFEKIRGEVPGDSEANPFR